MLVISFGEGNGTPLQYLCLENPRDGKPGWLPSMGSHRVRHDRSDAAAAAAALINFAYFLPVLEVNSILSKTREEK